jgi:hypothetical protein
VHGNCKDKTRFPLSIYQYAEFKPYLTVVKKITRRELKGVPVVSRTRIIDIIENTEEYRRAVEGVTVPNPGMWRPKDRPERYRERRVWNVMGVIMRDLGYYKYSDHAWCRTPLFPVEPEKTTDRPFQEESCGVLHTTLSTYSQEGRKEGRAGLETMGLV